MKRSALIFSALVFVSVANAKEYYVKDGDTFRKVEKTDAVKALLLKQSEVMACDPQRLTKKLTLKTAQPSDD